MSNQEQLITQHILEYESRLKHIDELYERARRANEEMVDDHEAKADLDAYARHKSLLADQTQKIKTMSLDNWREETMHSAGPMAIWDLLAQKLEDLVERLEHKKD
jgi:hypothetical protein